METIFFSVNVLRKDFEISYYVGENKNEVYYSDFKSFMRTKNKYENVNLKYIDLGK